MNRFSLVTLVLAFLLTPLFFLPITSDFFAFNKTALFLGLTALSLLGWLVGNLKTKTVRITISPLLLPVFLFGTSGVISAIVNQSASPETWLGRAGYYLSLPFFFLLFTTLIQNSAQVKKIIYWFVISVALLALLGIVSVLGLLESTSLPTYLISRGFSPTGSLLNLVNLLIVTLPLSLVLAFKTSAGPKKLQYFLASGIISSALILTTSQILPGKNFASILLPKIAGWSIAIDTLKTNPIFGVGPDNFLSQFTLFKPLSINNTPLWNIAFSVSANEYLHLLTTLGIAGLAAFVLIILATKKSVSRDPGTRVTATQMALNASLLTLFVLGLFVPFTISMLVTLAGLLSLTVGLNKAKNLTKVKDVILSVNAITLVEPYAVSPLPQKSSSLILPIFLLVPAVIGMTIGGNLIGRTYAAEMAFRNSLLAANENKGKETYDLQVKATTLAPNTDRYRLSYSNTNLALANSIAGGGNLSDQDRQTVATLIQQAIREARLATQISPNKASNWANLANVYRQLINFAEGADNFAAAAYVRAIQLDPANPRLRLEYGGLLYSLERYEEATDRFKEAAQLKPDYPNAYYNLSYAYQQQNKPLEAYQAMQQAAALTPADSADYVKVTQELTDLESKLPQPAPSPTPAANQPAQLTPPTSPLPAPDDFEPIELDETAPTQN